MKLKVYEICSVSNKSVSDSLRFVSPKILQSHVLVEILIAHIDTMGFIHIKLFIIYKFIKYAII